MLGRIVLGGLVLLSGLAILATVLAYILINEYRNNSKH